MEHLPHALTYDEAWDRVGRIFDRVKEKRAGKKVTDKHLDAELEAVYCWHCIQKIVTALEVKCKKCGGTDITECWDVVRAVYDEVLE